MTYDWFTESLRLIEGGEVAGAEPLTRRRRFLPVAVDVDDDIAVTVFLRRAHGGAEWENHTLSRTVDGWRLLGGGGSGPDDLDVLTHVITADELGGLARAGSAGASAISPSSRPLSGARWVRYSIITTTEDVRSVVVPGGRVLDRPAHGHIAVVWRDTERLPVTIISRDRQPLGHLTLES